MKRKSLLTMMLMLLFVATAWAQRTVTGTVRDEAGEGLPGATVQIKGTTKGTTTDIEGKYSLTVDEENAVLVYSFVNYKTQEVAVGSQTVIDITLSTELVEVVVTAYGVQKKEALTGSITEIKTKTISETPSGNPIQGLAGKVAGVQIVQDDGQPGSDPVVRFRGIGSINASSAPLYVVDGVPFYGNLNSINSQDIESMSFLKDASAAALYGSRGANGVIIITTKKGSKNKMQVTFDTRAGITMRGVPEYNIITDPGKYYEAYYMGLRNDMIVDDELDPAVASARAAQYLIEDPDLEIGKPLAYNAYNVPSDQVIDPTTGKIRSGAQLLYNENWGDYLFQNDNFYTQSYVSLAGGTDNTNYYFSLGYDNNKGYIINSGFEKYTAKMNISSKVNKWIEVGTNMNYAYTNLNYLVDESNIGSYSNPVAFARGIAPIYPVYLYSNGQRILDSKGNPMYDDGTGYFDADGNRLVPARPYASIQNPVATTLLDIQRTVNNNVFGVAFGKVNFTDYLNFTYNVAIDLRDGTTTEFDTPLYGDAVTANGRLYNYATRNMNVTQQQLLNFEKSFDLHNISVLVGHEYSSLNYRNLTAHKTNFLLPDNPVLDQAATIQSISGYERDYNVEGFLSRVTYDYDEKYYINASLRRDGSSVFAPENRWGTFFGIGGSWRVSQEEFMKKYDFINELKLKASYGEQGNDYLFYAGGNGVRNYYPYRDQFEVVPNNGALSVQLAYLGNENISWEVNKNFNVGFDFIALNNRLEINAEYFTRAVENMLFDTPLPLSTGNPSFPENVGDMVNRGIEVAVRGDVVRKKDLRVGLNLNLTHYKNEITRLPQDFIDDGIFRLVEGRSRYDYFMREFAGVNPENGNAQWYKDVLSDSGEPTGERELTENFSEATEYFLDKSPIPDLYGGFGIDGAYKGFDFNIGFAYQLGGKGRDNTYWALYDMSGDIGNNLSADVFSNTWTPENTSAPYPRLSGNTRVNDYASTHSMYLIDASFLSIQNISVGYTFSKNILEKVKLSGLRVYALSNNVALFSARKGYDPRSSLTGSSRNEYGIFRTITVGLNVQF